MASSHATPAVLSAADVVILIMLEWRLGSGPFLQGLRAVDGRAVVAAAFLGAVTSVACAWRWQLVARRFGAGLALPAAVSAYYRSQLLNTILGAAHD